MCKLPRPARHVFTAILHVECPPAPGLPCPVCLTVFQLLLPSQWQRVPAPCPGLGAALPAVLARSEAEAGCLVGRLPVKERAWLRTAALCLGRAQRMEGVELERVLMGRMLALALAAS